MTQLRLFLFQRVSFETTPVSLTKNSLHKFHGAVGPHPSPPPKKKKGKKIVVCPLIKTKNASVGPLFGNSCKPLFPPPPPWVKQHPTWVGPQYVSLCPLLVHTPSLGSQEYLFIPPPPIPRG